MSPTPIIKPPVRLANQTLLIDADDTLWENNIYFERAIASFISFLDHQVHTPEQVRSISTHANVQRLPRMAMAYKVFDGH